MISWPRILNHLLPQQLVHFSLNCLSLFPTPSSRKGTLKVPSTQVGSGGGVGLNTQNEGPPLWRLTKAVRRHFPPEAAREMSYLLNFFPFPLLPGMWDESLVEAPFLVEGLEEDGSSEHLLIDGLGLIQPCDHCYLDLNDWGGLVKEDLAWSLCCFQNEVWRKQFIKQKMGACKWYCWRS